jgi:hypothetical protein
MFITCLTSVNKECRLYIFLNSFIPGDETDNKAYAGLFGHLINVVLPVEVFPGLAHGYTRPFPVKSTPSARYHIALNSR